MDRKYDAERQYILEISLKFYDNESALALYKCYAQYVNIEIAKELGKQNSKSILLCCVHE